MTTSPITHILLSQAASDALSASGEKSFALVHRAGHPDSGRWMVSLAPIEWQLAVDASPVLLGTHRAVRCKPAEISQSATPEIV